jgi:hypothetical protein
VPSSSLLIKRIQGEKNSSSKHLRSWSLHPRPNLGICSYSSFDEFFWKRHFGTLDLSTVTTIEGTMKKSNLKENFGLIL